MIGQKVMLATTTTRTKTKTQVQSQSQSQSQSLSVCPLFVPPGPQLSSPGVHCLGRPLFLTPSAPSAPSHLTSHSQIYLEPSRSRSSRSLARAATVHVRRATLPTCFFPLLFFAAIDPFCALYYARLTRCISARRVTDYANCKAVSALPGTMRDVCDRAPSYPTKSLVSSNVEVTPLQVRFLGAEIVAVSYRVV